MTDLSQAIAAAFDPANAPADALAVNAAILKRLENWDNWAHPPETIRQMRREGRGAFPAPVLSPRARTMTIDGPHGPIGLRIITPEGPARGVYLHIHGGGWVLGSSTSRTSGWSVSPTGPAWPASPSIIGSPPNIPIRRAG